ncbi:DsbA family oxidoreductase [Actinomadura sp. 1N219]|uniref:DsbA family oxidoreductase n=1 Tax=Actinomadura sp. 1N219 TaxID=3375152 RepID=UPI0037A8A694
MDSVTVDVWSDVVCPWCYIGKRRFETALDGFGHRDSVRVRWRSFELDPSGSREAELTLPERISRDLGGDVEQAAQRIAMVSGLAAEAGLDYRLDRARPVNSFDAHRLMQYGDQAGAGEEVRERLMRAYTAEGAVVSDIDTLVRIGAEAGLDPRGTEKMLRGTDFADTVRADEDLGHRLGVSGVPTFVFAGRYAVSGAQPVEVFMRLLDEAASASQDS